MIAVGSRCCRDSSSVLHRTLSQVIVLTLVGWLSGCSGFSGHSSNREIQPLRIVVGPVHFEAPISKASDIYSFDEEISLDAEPVLLRELIEEIELKAHRFLIQQLGRQPGLQVVSFPETRRMLTDIAPTTRPWTEAELSALGATTDADVVLSGLIHDYGKVRWQYWVTGWLTHVTAWTTALGIASAWNPAVIGPYLAIDATTDFPLWYGGASVFGWTFRPVRVHVDVIQARGCQGMIWTHDELAIKVPGKTLADMSPELRKRKEVQLEINLDRAMGELAGLLREEVDLQPCTREHRPEEIGGFSLMSLFDFLL